MVSFSRQTNRLHTKKKRRWNDKHFLCNIKNSPWTSYTYARGEEKYVGCAIIRKIWNMFLPKNKKKKECKQFFEQLFLLQSMIWQGSRWIIFFHTHKKTSFLKEIFYSLQCFIAARIQTAKKRREKFYKKKIKRKKPSTRKIYVHIEKYLCANYRFRACTDIIAIVFISLFYFFLQKQKKILCGCYLLYESDYLMFVKST